MSSKAEELNLEPTAAFKVIKSDYVKNDYELWLDDMDAQIDREYNEKKFART